MHNGDTWSWRPQLFQAGQTHPDAKQGSRPVLVKVNIEHDQSVLDECNTLMDLGDATEYERDHVGSSVLTFHGSVEYY